MIRTVEGRFSIRPLSIALISLALVAVLFPSTAHALEKRMFGDVVVGPGETAPRASTIYGDITVRGPVEGDVETGFGDIEVHAPVGGDVEADFGDVYINSRVDGAVDVEHGDVELGPDARIEALHHGSGRFDSHAGATVEDRRVAGMASGLERSAEDPRVLGFVGWFFATLVFVACSVLLAVVAPGPLSASARRLEEMPGRSLLLGLASVPAAVILAIIFAVSIVGIPVLLLAAPAYLAFVFFGALVSSYFLGRRILFATGRYHTGNAPAAAVGALIVAATHLIPWAGSLILYGLALLGAGATILAIFSRRISSGYTPF